MTPPPARKRISAIRREQGKVAATSRGESPLVVRARIMSSATTTQRSRRGERRVDERRTMRSGPKVSWTAASPVPVLSAMISTQRRPAPAKSSSTLESVGTEFSQMCSSLSVPSRAMSFGTDKPAAAAASSTCAAMASLAQ